MPREFSRRCRTLDFSVLKAQEMRNIILFFYPIILQSIPNELNERKLWLLFSYCIRASVSTYFNEKEINNYMTQFYTLFEQTYGPQNCTYTVHVVCSHLAKIRNNKPLTCTSAFPFESFYSELRNSFVPGTISPLKQIFQSILLKRLLSKHVCELTILYSKKSTAMEDLSLIHI